MKFYYFLRTVGKHKLNPQKCKYSTEVEVDIPNRIPRGPTDILKALRSTVVKDPSAPHYKYHDDPFLIPYSNFTKRSYALSQESGRKAAQWIRQQHADLFHHKVAEPLIETYLPKIVYNEETEVSENILKELIDKAFVSDAVIVYNLLKSKNIVIDSSTKQSFLELLCFFNEQEPISEEWIEERWYSASSRIQKDTKTWKNGGLAEQVFNEIKSEIPASYSAVICGMCKYNQIDGANQLYNEAQSNNVPLNVETYNALLSKARLLNENHFKIWEFIQMTLKSMAEIKVKPNLKTLNAVLHSLSRTKPNINARKYALQTLAEFRLLKIEPSLASFYYLLELYVNIKEELSSILPEILNYLRNRSYSIGDTNDILFFTRAMEICCYQLQSKDVLYMIHNILFTGNNYNLIGDSFSESLYYRYFFFLLCDTEELSKVMDFYDNLVPNVYIPEPAVMNTILKTVSNNLAWEIMPRLWSDILIFEQYEITSVVETVLECASQNTDQAFLEEMSKIAWSVWEKINDIKRERSPFQWTASALGNMLLIFLKSGDKAKANLVMDKLVRLRSTLVNEPNIQAMSLYIDSCIEDSSPAVAIKCIQYCNDLGFMETSEFARRLSTSIDLSPQLFQKLVAIVGEDCLKVKNKKEPIT